MVEGRLREVPLEDVFGLIAAGRKSGLLTIELDGREARVHFEEGQVLYARVEDGASLGEYLVRLELLAPEDVQVLIARQLQENPHTPLGMMAVRGGAIGEEDLRAALEAQVLDALTEVLAWSDNPRARFSLRERGADVSQVATSVSLDARGLLMEAARRVDEWRRGRVRSGTVLEPTPGALEALRGRDLPQVRDGRLSLAEWELIHLADGRRSAASIAAELGVPEGETFRRLHELLERGLLRESMVRPQDPVVLVVSESPTVRRLIGLALTRGRFVVRQAGSLEAALVDAAAGRPDSVVLDLAEPLGAARALRRVRGCAHLPVVALSSPGSLGWRARLASVRVVSRPFNDDELVEAVSAVSGRAV
ncbi:MAG TPA: response regulator [Deinococcales bacterium]|nr:response regulator [Deinococcales bacterium]